MKFIKSVDGITYGNPIDEKELKKRYPNRSFPKSILQDHVMELDYRIIKEIERPTATEYQIVEEGPIQFVDGEYITSWMISDMTEEQIQSVDNAKASKIRKARDNMLADTDWLVTKSYESGEPVPADWVSYRQALRDITTQTNFPYSVEWPLKPQGENK